MKAVNLLINSMLPEELQDPNRQLDKKSIANLLAQVGEKYPERYSEIVKKLSDIGRYASYEQGETIGLNDLKPVMNKDNALARMDQEIEQAKSEAKSPEDYRRRQMDIWSRYATELEDATMKGVSGGRHNLGNIISSGARGNPFQLKAMLTTPALYTDYKDQPIPLFVRRSYSEGLRPSEYLASTFGVRKGVISTKKATADAGDLCLAAGTFVRMADGGAYPIEEIEIGDWVLGADANGVIKPALVTQTFDRGLQSVRDYHLYHPEIAEPQCHLRCTADHKFLYQRYNEDGHRGELTVGSIGDCALTPDLTLLATELGVGRHCVDLGHEHQEQCYDIEVDNHDHLFVLASGVICSNSKQMVQSSADVNVTEEDCGVSNGIDFDADDPDMIGRVLQSEVAGHPAGTVIDKHVFSDLRRSKADKAIVRSPLTCQAKNGICSKCMGTLPNGKFPPIGYSAGVAAAQAIGEPIAQEGLNTKHGGGGFTGEKKVFAGMPVLSQLVQSPETFPDRAAVANRRGKVTKIEEASQGGSYIHVDDEPHYALPGMEAEVKEGDEVEEGDQLSEGVVDPTDVMRHRGLGEARRYYVDRLQQAMEDSGLGRPSEINLELLARGAMDHVRVNDLEGMGEYLPDDIASYNKLSYKHQPNSDARMESVNKARDKYLQAPALHYTIGTKITPRMTQRLKKAGYGKLAVSDKPPGFEPEMVRLRSSKHGPGDWLAKMHTSYLGSNLEADAARGQDTNIERNPHFAPRLMHGKNFGKKIQETGEF